MDFEPNETMEALSGRKDNWVACLPIEVCFTSVVKVASGFVLDEDEKCLSYKLDVDRSGLCCFECSDSKDACIKVCCEDGTKTINCPVEINVTKLVGCLSYCTQVKDFKRVQPACSCGLSEFTDSGSVSISEIVGYSCSGCPVRWDDLCERFRFECRVEDIFVVAPCQDPVSLFECPGAIDVLKCPENDKYLIFKSRIIICDY